MGLGPGRNGHHLVVSFCLLVYVIHDRHARSSMSRGNFAEFIWNRWTRQIAPVRDDAQPVSKQTGDSVEWIPRPLWQRAGLTLLVLAGGSGIAIALLLAQARTITRIIRLPNSAKVRVETARNMHGRGRIVEQTEIAARKGRGQTELTITPNRPILIPSHRRLRIDCQVS